MTTISPEQPQYVVIPLIVVVILSSIHICGPWGPLSKTVSGVVFVIPVIILFVNFGVTLSRCSDYTFLSSLILSGFFGLITEYSLFSKITSAYFPYSIIVWFPVFAAQICGVSLSYLGAHHDKAILVAHVGSSLLHVSGVFFLFRGYFQRQRQARDLEARQAGDPRETSEGSETTVLPLSSYGVVAITDVLLFIHYNTVWATLGHTISIITILSLLCISKRRKAISTTSIQPSIDGEKASAPSLPEITQVSVGEKKASAPSLSGTTQASIDVQIASQANQETVTQDGVTANARVKLDNDVHEVVDIDWKILQDWEESVMKLIGEVAYRLASSLSAVTGADGRVIFAGDDLEV